jgi:hypothetical protein
MSGTKKEAMACSDSSGGRQPLFRLSFQTLLSKPRHPPLYFTSTQEMLLLLHLGILFSHRFRRFRRRRRRRLGHGLFR